MPAGFITGCATFTGILTGYALTQLVSCGVSEGTLSNPYVQHRGARVSLPVLNTAILLAFRGAQPLCPTKD
eukprot:1160649-Pelagomonas_calceolata.AAC.9